MNVSFHTFDSYSFGCFNNMIWFDLYFFCFLCLIFFFIYYYKAWWFSIWCFWFLCSNYWFLCSNYWFFNCNRLLFYNFLFWRILWGFYFFNFVFLSWLLLYWFWLILLIFDYWSILNFSFNLNNFSWYNCLCWFSFILLFLRDNLYIVINFIFSWSILVSSLFSFVSFLWHFYFLSVYYFLICIIKSWLSHILKYYWRKYLNVSITN